MAVISTFALAIEWTTAADVLRKGTTSLTTLTNPWHGIEAGYALDKDEISTAALLMIQRIAINKGRDSRLILEFGPQI